MPDRTGAADAGVRLRRDPPLTSPGDDMTARFGFRLDGIVAADLPCAGCGYNHRSLSVESVCPECRESVLQSEARAWGGCFRKRHWMGRSFRHLTVTYL